MKKLMWNPSNNAILIIKSSSPDLFDYLGMGYIELMEGWKKDVTNALDDFWEEHSDILPENRIVLTERETYY